MGMSTWVKLILLIISIGIGVGVVYYVSGPLLPFLDEQLKIIMAIVLSLFSFIALYFIAKGGGGS